jgi:hypothetical protein
VVAYAWAREFPRRLIERHTASQKLATFENLILSKIQQAALLPTSRLKKRFQPAIVEYLKQNAR